VIQLTPNYYFSSSDLYQLLGHFAVLTTRELAGALQSGALARDVRNILQELGLNPGQLEGLASGFDAIAAQNRDADEFFHALRRDYSQLFSSPRFSVSTLYQSDFLGEAQNLQGNRLVLPQTIREVRAAYQQAGFDSCIAPEKRADHLAVELEFMQTLRRNQAIALQAKDDKAYNEISATAEGFLKTHLSKWAVSLYRDIEEKAEEDVYRYVGALGAAFLENELSS